MTADAANPDAAGPGAERPRPPRAWPIPPYPLYRPESEETVWSGRFALQRVRFRYVRQDGSPSPLLTWEMWRRGNGTIILPWDPVTDRVALIEQFRLPALAAGEDPVMTEIPAGLLEAGEDPLAAARRELREETGLVAGRVESFGRFMLMQGGCDELLYFHVAEVSLDGVADGPRGLEGEGEETVVTVVPADAAFAMVAENRVRNAPCALALLWLQVNRDRLRRAWGITE